MYSGVRIQNPSAGLQQIGSTWHTVLNAKLICCSVQTTTGQDTMSSISFSDVSPLSKDSNNKIKHTYLSFVIQSFQLWRRRLQVPPNVNYFYYSDSVPQSENLHNAVSLIKKNHILLSHSDHLYICNTLCAIWQTVTTALSENVRPGTLIFCPVVLSRCLTLWHHNEMLTVHLCIWHSF